MFCSNWKLQFKMFANYSESYRPEGRGDSVAHQFFCRGFAEGGSLRSRPYCLGCENVRVMVSLPFLSLQIPASCCRNFLGICQALSNYYLFVKLLDSDSGWWHSPKYIVTNIICQPEESVTSEVWRLSCILVLFFICTLSIGAYQNILRKQRKILIIFVVVCLPW